MRQTIRSALQCCKGGGEGGISHTLWKLPGFLASLATLLHRRKDRPANLVQDEIITPAALQIKQCRVIMCISSGVLKWRQTAGRWGQLGPLHQGGGLEGTAMKRNRRGWGWGRAEGKADDEGRGRRGRHSPPSPTPLKLTPLHRPAKQNNCSSSITNQAVQYNHTQIVRCAKRKVGWGGVGTRLETWVITNDPQ